MKKKFVCPICGFVFEGTEAPERCPQCKQVVTWKEVASDKIEFIDPTEDPYYTVKTSVTVEVEFGEGIATYKYLVDSTDESDWETAEGGDASGEVDIVLTDLKPGEHQLVVRAYDESGELMMSVSDRNFNGAIDWTGPDLIQSNAMRYVKLDNSWWRESRRWSVHRDGSAEPQLVATSRTRVTGLGVAQTVPSAPSRETSNTTRSSPPSLRWTYMTEVCYRLHNPMLDLM